MIRRLPASLAACLLLAAPLAAQSLDGHPFHALSPATLPWGGHIIETGLEYRTSTVPSPLTADDKGDLLKAPEIRYRVGFGRAELSIGGAAWQSFEPESSALDDQHENGDVSFWLSVSVLEQRRGRIGVGLALGAKMPEASDWTGLGTDEADTFFAVLLGQSKPSWEWRFNLGMAILGDPTEKSAQEDMVTYSLAGRIGRRHCFAWEVYGRTFASDAVRELDESTLSAGYLFNGRRVSADLSLLVGLEENSGDLGASAGVSWKLGEAVR